MIIKSFAIYFLSFCFLLDSFARPGNKNTDTTAVSTPAQALDFIRKSGSLPQSKWWPNIKSDAYLENIRSNIISPLQVYEGSNTNFCGYAALTYLPLHTDPLGYARFMLEIYTNGKAKYGNVNFEPSSAVRQASGTLRFKGTLDVRPADQLWFMSLADHFKGYVNFFNKKYDPEDENTFWASVNYSKFNRMVKALFNFKVHARGSDLLHPCIKSLYNYIHESMQSGINVLYLNNAYLYKRKHNMLRPGIPTHYVVLLGLERIGDKITLTYWDYGFRSLREITPAFLKKIVFGISHCTIKANHAS